MPDYDYDLFVIGAGSGGVRASRMAAFYGAKVAVAEERFLGGTCVNIGCVPKKLFVYASHFVEDFENSEGFGWSREQAKFSWPTLIENKNKEISRLNDVYGNLLDSSGVKLFDGRATILDAHTISINGTSVTAKKILIAVGGKPFVPDFPGSEYTSVSDDVFYLEQLPKRAVVVGGGYIAVEFAGIFNALGVETRLVYRGDKILRHFDDEVADFATEQYAGKGLDILHNTTVDKIEKMADSFLCHLSNGETLACDYVLYATGRRALTENLGLENTNVKIRYDGTLVVNDQFQTDESSIFALGDVTGGPELTPVALAEAMVFTANQFNAQEKVMDYENIATAVFSQPNIAVVGLTEKEAKERYSDILVYTSSFRHLKYTLTNNQEKTFMKLLVDKASDKVIGAHMVGADAGEIIQGIAIAIKAGATKEIFDATIGIHPTAAEEFVTMREPV